MSTQNYFTTYHVLRLLLGPVSLHMFVSVLLSLCNLNLSVFGFFLLKFDKQMRISIYTFSRFVLCLTWQQLN